MKLGIISDTHGNLEALTACLATLKEAGAEEFVCLGDTVGYGANPNECADLIRKTVVFTILGNHDAAVAGRMDYTYYRDDAREVLDYHKKILTNENMAWLRGLEYTHTHRGVGFCHGSPLEPSAFEYIFMEEHAEDLLPVYERLPPLTFIGHSHLCRAFELAPSGVADLTPVELKLDPEKKYIVSVGSVGQPRDYDPRAACGLYDIDAAFYQLVRVPYDIDAAASKILAAGLSPIFAKRLFIGV